MSDIDTHDRERILAELGEISNLFHSAVRINNDKTPRTRRMSIPSQPVLEKKSIPETKNKIPTNALEKFLFVSENISAPEH